MVIRPIKEQDLSRLWELNYRDATPEWKQWDAPYFEHKAMPYEEFQQIEQSLIQKDDMWVIEVDGIVYGTVSYYFEGNGREWLEMGIILHQSDRWNRGVGTRALRLWTEHLFETLPVVRVGLTTWSGNERMMRVAEKIGMQLEGRIRQVRVVNEKHYDSIRMGLLREEWNEKR